MAHDELGATVGDKVRIVETRPLSAQEALARVGDSAEGGKVNWISDLQVSIVAEVRPLLPIANRQSKI